MSNITQWFADMVAAQKFRRLEWTLDTTGRIKNKYGVEVVGTPDAAGYIIIGTKWNGEKINIMKHRAVWIGANGGLIPEDPSLQIDHIDGDKSNNHPDNLRITTPSENIRNPNTHWKTKGENNHNAKLTKQDTQDIKREWNETRSLPKGKRPTQKQLAVKYGVPQQQISKIIRGLAWSEVSA